jgi:hypothetical protein
LHQALESGVVVERLPLGVDPEESRRYVVGDLQQSLENVERPRVVDGQDVRVLKPSCEPDLALEPLTAERGPELRMEDLKRYRPAVPQIASEKDSVAIPPRPSSRSIA